MKCRKILAVLLSMLMAFSTIGLFAVSAEDSCDCGYAPNIYVIGFASRTLVYNQGKEDEKAVFVMDSDYIKEAATNLLTNSDNYFNVASFLATGNYSYLSKVLDNLGYEIFKYLEMDSSGKSIYDVTEREWSYPTEFQLENHDPDDEYDFYYDWRDDPFVVAAELNEYVNYICEGTGHDKVNLIGFSLGSAQVMTYLYQYGYDHVAAVELRAPAFNGVSVCGQPMSKKLDTDASALVRCVDSYLTADGTGSLISVLLDAVNKAGLVPGLVDGLMDVIENCTDEVYAGNIGRIFASLPGMWALMSDDDYENAKEAVLKGRDGADEFEKIIDNYHYNVQANNKKIIDDFMAQGGKFAIIVKYNVQISPAAEDYLNLGDGVIDTKYESFGATCANLGETLGEDYVQAVDDGHNHISPDNMIDASTCTYPEYTWFVKGLNHPKHADYIESLTREIFYADTQMTVWDNPDYPQFVEYDAETEEVSEITESEPDFFEEMFGANSWAMVLVNFIKAILKFISELFSK